MCRNAGLCGYRLNPLFARILLRLQVNTQKNEFRKLKQEVGTSQTVVYKAAQGYIRNRPVTAPNFTMYDTRHIQEAQRRESRAIQHALNEKVQRLIKRTENKDISEWLCKANVKCLLF